MLKKINNNFFDFMIVFVGISLKYCDFLFHISKICIYVYFAILLVLTFLSTKNSKLPKKELLKYVVLIFSVLILTFQSSGIDFVIPLLYAIYFKNRDIKSILKYILISSIIMFSLTILLANLNLVSSVTMNRLENGIVLTRNSLGFIHVNSAFMHFFIIAVLLFLFVNKKKILVIFILFVAFYLYTQTYCRTGLFCTILFAAFILLIPKKIQKKMVKNGQFFFLIFTILSFILAFMFGKNSGVLDELVSERFSNWYGCITNYSLVNFSGVDSIFYLDNIYINMIYNYGIISYLLYFLLYFISFKKIDNYKIKIILLFFLIYGLFESNHVFYINCSLFVLIYYFINYKENFRGVFDEKN